MNNPWEEIPLVDYENHMKLDSVMQLQAMNEMMKGQLDTYSICSYDNCSILRCSWKS